MRCGSEEMARRAQPADAAPLRMLCPVDLAQRPQGAALRAIAMARELDAALTLVHVAPPDGSVAAFAAAPGQPEVRVQSGEFLPTVAAIARESGTEVIVLDAPAATRHGPMIDPGVEQLAHQARCAVLILRRKSEAQYSAVLVAAEHSAVFERVIRAASGLRLLQRDPVLVIHGFESGYGGALHGAGFDARAARRNLQEWELAAVRRLRQDFDAAGVRSEHFQLVFHPAGSRRQLQRQVRRLAPDILVVATANRPALERVMRPAVGNDALRHNQCDILLGPM